MLGTREAQQILLEALENPKLQIQHTSACALERFPSAEARERAKHWRARLDGINSPECVEVSIEGRTLTSYTFDEVKHANMDIFLVASLDRIRNDFKAILVQRQSE